MKIHTSITVLTFTPDIPWSIQSLGLSSPPFLIAGPSTAPPQLPMGETRSTHHNVGAWCNRSWEKPIENNRPLRPPLPHAYAIKAPSTHQLSTSPVGGSHFTTETDGLSPFIIHKNFKSLPVQITVGCVSQIARHTTDCVEIAVRSIQDNPKMFRVYYSAYRGCVIRRFPFSIFYTIEDNEIVVHSIFDNRQDPKQRP